MTSFILAHMMSGCPLCLFVSASQVQIMWFFGSSARNFLQYNPPVTHPGIASLSLILPHFSLSFSGTKFFFQVRTGHRQKPDSFYSMGVDVTKDKEWFGKCNLFTKNTSVFMMFKSHFYFETLPPMSMGTSSVERVHSFFSTLYIRFPACRCCYSHLCLQ